MCAVVTSVLTPGNIVRPEIEPKHVTSLTGNIFGLSVLHMTELNSYDDRNFLVRVSEESENENISEISPDGYVLKVLNSLDSEYEDAIDAQNALILHLHDKGIITPRPLKSVDHCTKSCQVFGNVKYIVRLFEYLPGRILAGLQYTKDITFNVGKLAGKLDKCCQNFHHAGFDNHKRIWSLTEVPKLIDFLSFIQDMELRKFAEDVINTFTNNVVKNYHMFQKGIIHGDFNEQNILVNQKQNGEFFVSGILDFGDAAYSFYVFEIAITMCYMILESTVLEPLTAGGYTLAGYLSEFSLQKADMDVIKECICARLVQSLIMGTYSSAMHPENSQYYLLTSAKGWKMLNNIWNTPKEKLNEIWLQCFTECGVTSPW